MPSGSVAPAVEMRGIERRFGSTVALDGVDLTLRSGEIHALLGSNGAGKSTLMKVLVGLEEPDAGTVDIMGAPVDRFDPGAIRARGVAMVQQHFTLIPTLTAGENLVLARPESRRLPDRAGCRARVEQLIERFGLPVRTDVPAGELSVGEQQRLELLRALDADARVLLLDEPTAVLTDHEAAHLLVVCRKLADDGRAVAVITHRLGEVFAGCDRVTVLREGREVIGDDPVSAHTRADLATAMIGSIATGKFTERARPQHDAADSQAQGPPRLSVSGLRSGMLAGVDLDLYPGEIVAIAGVDGNGQADLEAALSGRTQPDGGSVQVDGVDMAVSQPRARRGYGVAYIPSDRYRWGLVRPMDLADNLELGRVAAVRRRRRHRRADAADALEAWNVRSAGPAARTATLSGGNAQKLVLARELDEEPAVVLACYPTRGLDPSAADSVAGKLIERAERGASVLWIGSELDELFAVADRLFVMFDGRFTGPFKPPFDRAAIGLAMAGAELDTDGEMVVDVRDGVGVAEAGS
ncbi:MAG: ATP-binding cassette domain-containing protein [Acidimicrobiales bacterium]|nr:ATP-binding cassette domain-containing protein [Acidimicrobiales bacterium]